MYSKIIKFTVLILSIVGILSCGGKVIYQETKAITEPWNAQDSISFMYEITDTIVPYDLMLEIVHTPTYSYENLYVMVNTLFPDGTIKRGPLTLQLSNNNGSWIGKCNDEQCDTKLYLSSKAYYKTPGKYTLSFAQFSRNEQLPGVKSLTLSVLQSSK